MLFNPLEQLVGDLSLLEFDVMIGFPTSSRAGYNRGSRSGMLVLATKHELARCSIAQIRSYRKTVFLVRDRVKCYP